eukprot:5448537-Pyramimonas_sp.AAC.1
MAVGAAAIPEATASVTLRRHCGYRKSSRPCHAAPRWRRAGRTEMSKSPATLRLLWAAVGSPARRARP